MSKQLADLFNLSFKTGVFPSVLKTVKVIPLFKKDSKLDYSNYCLITLISNIEKIIEKLMYMRLYTFLNPFMMETVTIQKPVKSMDWFLYDNSLRHERVNNKNMYDLQFGFIQQYSTCHALINITENIRKALDDRFMVCGVFVDLVVINFMYSINYNLIVSTTTTIGCYLIYCQFTSCFFH